MHTPKCILYIYVQTQTRIKEGRSARWQKGTYEITFIIIIIKNAFHQSAVSH